MKSLLARSSPRPFSGVVMVLLLLSCNGESPTAPLAQPPPPAQPQPPAATGVVSGTVLAPSGACLPGAVVEVLDGARAGDRLTQSECGSVWDDGPAGYSFSLPAGIKVRMRASKEGYRSKEETFLATSGPAGQSNFVLEPE